MEEIFGLEFKRNLKNKNVTACIIIYLIISLLILLISIGKVKKEARISDEFAKLESSKVSNAIDLFQFNFYFIRILFKSSPIGVLFYNNSSFGDLHASTDIRVKIDINKPIIGSNMFKDATRDYLDLIWFILIIGSLLTMAWSFFSYRNSTFIRLLHNFTSSSKRVFLSIFFARVLIIIIVQLILGILCYTVFIINGLSLNLTETISLIGAITASIFLITFFMLIASILGTIKNLFIGATISFFTWFSFTVFIPTLYNSIFSNIAESDTKSIYKHEFQKSDIFIKFEKMMYEKIKRLNTLSEKREENKRLIEQYINTDFVKIQKLEEEMISDIRNKVNKYQFISIFTPVTFYYSINNELSSKGFNEFLRFYTYMKNLHRNFVLYYFNIRLKGLPIKPFIKDDNFVFKAKPSLPNYFNVGLLFNLFILLVLIWISYFRFKRAIFPVTKNAGGFKDVDLKLISGKYLVYSCADDDRDFPDQLYNALSGKIKYPGKISIDDKYLVPGEEQDFFYIPSPDAVPENIKNGVLIDLFSSGLMINKKEKKTLKEEFAHIINKRFGDLSIGEKIAILAKLASLKKSKIYLLDDLFYHVPKHEAKEICKRVIDIIKEKDTIIIEIAALSAAKHSYFYLYSGFHRNPDSIYRERILGDKS